MKVTTIRSRFRIKRRSYNQLLFLSVLAISYFSGVSADPSGTKYEICQSDKCKELADELLSGMNEAIKPCDDFYGYVCGNFAEKHQIPKDLVFGPTSSYLVVLGDGWSYFDVITDKTNNHLQEILKSVPIAGEGTSIQKAKQLYRSCMDKNAIENEGVTLLMNYIDEIGGWPIIMNPTLWQLTAKPWQFFANEYSVIMGASTIIQLDVIHNDHSLSHPNAFLVYPPEPENVPPPPNSRNLDDFFSKPLTANHIKFIKEIARIMARTQGLVLDENQLEQDARGIILFESKLKAMSSYQMDKAYLTAIDDDKFDLRRLFPNTTIAIFQKFYDSWVPKKTWRGKIDWLKRIQESLALANSITIDSSGRTKLDNQSFLIVLPDLLDRTPERDIVNTIQWWFVKQSLNYLNQEMIEIFEKYSKGDFPVVGNRRKRPIPQSRSLRCVAQNKLEDPLAFAYVQKYFPKGTIKPAILGMFNEIKLEMGEEISQSKWLDMESKHATMEKLDKMAIFIGYPDWYKNWTVMDEGYEGLSIGSSYFENMLLVKRFIVQKKLNLLGKAIDKTTWKFSPVTVNAYSENDQNAIVFPAGFLQMPYFDADYPDPINYGSIGFYISHEMTHGFESVGSLYDKDGNPIDIWSANTISKFVDKTHCLIDQFDNYGRNRRNTVDDDIADSAGIRTSFEAFKRHMNNSHYIDVKLPGLENFTAEQLYFLSYARSMCEYVRPEFRELVNADVHSPGHLRVRGSLSNSEGFSEAFQCPKESPMNPLKKCSYWQ